MRKHQRYFPVYKHQSGGKPGLPQPAAAASACRGLLCLPACFLARLPTPLASPRAAAVVHS